MECSEYVALNVGIYRVKLHINVMCINIVFKIKEVLVILYPLNFHTC